MKKRIAIFVFGWILIYLVFFELLPSLTNKYHGCYIHEDIYKQNINAIVSGKFIDAANHNNKTIVYLTGGYVKGQMIFPGYLEDMYDYLAIGDSIIKEKNSIYYRAKSNLTHKDTVFKFYTTCKDSLK